jgi:hypothetical protein
MATEAAFVVPALIFTPDSVAKTTPEDHPIGFKIAGTLQLSSI